MLPVKCLICSFRKTIIFILKDVRMKKILGWATLFASFLFAAIWLNQKGKNTSLNFQSLKISKQSKEVRALYVRERLKYEYDMLKDPGTGKIPYNIRSKEMALARTIPVKSFLSGIQSIDNLNTYLPAGPNNIGGRTRAIVYDKRFNNSSNRVIIAGCVSGGIMRSEDGGATWTRVSPENDIHNLSALVQDPRAGSEDTWYAGGGEPISNSANATGAAYLSHGVWKSVNNGVTWTKLTLQVTDIGGGILPVGTLENFDNAFDFVHGITVNPSNGHVYVAGHRRLVRSTDGGASWNVVFAGPTPATSAEGQMDIVSTTAGKLYLAVNGGFPDRDRRGVWTSVNGTSWTRIAGGSVLNVDSVADWRGNSPIAESRRIILALAPSNQNILYVLYENGLSQDGANPKPEADMYKLDVTTGSNVWTNLSANMPDFPGQLDGVDPLEVQDGYNMTLAVKPDDPNTVFVGGTNLFRSTSGFSNTSATAWIGGYGQDFPSGLSIYPNSHPDIHNLAFMPNNAGINPGFTKAICANDGGIQSTANITAVAATNPVTWSMITNYQTLQYYHVAMDPTSGQNNFIGGSQDNGTRIRVNNSNDHIRIISGDGGASAIGSVSGPAFTFYGSSQLGNIYRDITNTFTTITPTGLTPAPGFSDAWGEFVTYFKIDFNNPEDIYYVNFNRVFRTKNASTVTSSTWNELTGVGAAVNPANPAGTNIAIRALELSRGSYASTHVMYIGTTNGKVFRLDDPRNAAASATPIDITPPDLENLRTQNRAVTISDIAINPNDDNEIMVVVSNYSVTMPDNSIRRDFNIWWTNNAKSASPTWKNAEGNLTLPSIRSCVIAVKKDASNNLVTEYYVGTSVGLYSTTSMTGAVNWVREGGNVLNFAIVSSMDYRPADNVLLVGTHGNGMYFANVGASATGINDPVRNDKNFIERAYPTLVNNNKIEYRIGNMFTIKKITVQIHNLSGQLLQRKETPYQSGEVNVMHLPKGAYILSITSQDNKQQFVQKFVKD